MDKIIFEQIVQYGFAGLAAAELLALVWLVQRLLRVLEDNTRIIAGNTHALRTLAERQRDLTLGNDALKDRLLTRPCLRSVHG